MEMNIGNISDMAGNTYGIPESFETEYELYHIPSGYKRTLIAGDIHVPFHSVEAVTKCIEYAKKERVDSVLLNGDIFDFYRLSKFSQDPMQISLKEELKVGEEFLIAMLKALPRAKFYFKVGNHEERLRSYLKMRAPELFGLPYFDFSEFLQLRSKGIGLIDDNRIVMSGKLPVLHGHEIRLGAGSVNPARALYLKFKTSAVTSHLHQTSDHTETSGLGKIISTHSIGCLSELHPKYAPINKWNHGFAINYVSDGGSYEFRNLKIVKGKVV